MYAKLLNRPTVFSDNSYGFLLLCLIRDLLLDAASSPAQRQAAAASTADRIRAKYGRPARDASAGAGPSRAGGGMAGEVLSSMHDNQNKLSERGEKLSVCVT